ncbi:Hsp33 family molecular chaperone HslO [Guptibacillus hwajinpoensis]|uniref:Molecular chaperone Hsp33 n=2 Tax=Guptibacillus hwajinpoensis TaxID=208199 RepID=A0ABU0K6S3_9BACL|nr:MULTISPECIES: Hsp33 family molecular chaperone HslO [Alkalihalobacillus]KMM36005.1 heat shock protein Hsp33 [Alkalihalobacillus macyae]MDP4553353.1 Hsp33 family molecular chaperone HslO [Alkalihalobacillus macyae]MDQ0485073.1 molecular chaperone Hsp33 [Alkalihalobacillus hemicentroti]
MNDYLIKALAFDGNVRAYAISSTEMVAEAQRRHTTWPTASAALGRAMTASTMMASGLKGKEKITVKIEGGGPIGAIIVDANAQGETRGYVSNPHVHFDLNEQGKLDVARAVGRDGFLSVVKDIGMREKFTGQVPIVSGELGDDFTYYLVTSEQVPSAVGVGVLVNPDNTILSAGGFMIQLLPGAEEETIRFIEKRIEAIPPISKLIQDGKTPEEILNELLGEENIKILDKMPVKFECSCSKERFSNGIMGLGKEEINNMIEEDGEAETSCHFCNAHYHFSKEELQELYKESKL